MSAGNHAQGVAYHAQQLGMRAVIVMPRFTPGVKVERTRSFGAQVVLHGDTLEEARSHAYQLAEQQGLEFVHPYDDGGNCRRPRHLGVRAQDQPDLGRAAGRRGRRRPDCGHAPRAAKALKPDDSGDRRQTARFPSMVNAIQHTDTRWAYRPCEGIASLPRPAPSPADHRWPNQKWTDLVAGENRHPSKPSDAAEMRNPVEGAARWPGGAAAALPGTLSGPEGGPGAVGRQYRPAAAGLHHPARHGCDRGGWRGCASIRASAGHAGTHHRHRGRSGRQHRRSAPPRAFTKLAAQNTEIDIVLQSAATPMCKRHLAFGSRRSCAGHAACNGVVGKAHLHAFVAQGAGDVVDGVLRLRHGHAVAGHDDHALGVAQQLGRIKRADGHGLALGFSSRCVALFGGCARAKAARDHADEVAVHGGAHDVAQDGARGAGQRAGDDEQIVAEHEARGRRRPAGVAVEHGDHHRHIRTANRHHHVDAEQQRDHRHHGQRQHALGHGFGADEFAAKPDDDQERRQVEPMAARQQQRLAADLAVELAKGDQRAREGDGADQDADVDFDFVNDFLGALQRGRCIDITGKTHQAGGQAHQACIRGEPAAEGIASASSSPLWRRTGPRRRPRPGRPQSRPCLRC
ncbi:hypothetical protein FQA39_LY19170 [Lamprigera yunnana]|nr:hypothetical protein FQA39_LY19170 [Lamprigera yunnana]